jgi:hypothetical protein
VAVVVVAVCKATALITQQAALVVQALLLLDT